MKKMLILLAIATLPAASGCCCARLCPFCPCNWFNRGAYCAPGPTYAAPLAAATCPPSPCAPSPCAPVGTYPPVVQSMGQPFMPQQYAGPPAAPMMTQAQPMYYQAQPTPAYYAEPSCSYAGEQSCAASNVVSYGPMVDCGPCSSCSSCDSCGSCNSCGNCNSGCSGSGTPTTANPPAPERFEPTPGA